MKENIPELHQKTGKNATNDANFQNSLSYFAEKLQITENAALASYIVLKAKGYPFFRIDEDVKKVAEFLGFTLPFTMRLVQGCPNLLLYNPLSIQEKIKFIRNLLNIRYDQLLPALAKCPKLLDIAHDRIAKQYMCLWKTLGFAKLDIVEMFRECPSIFLLPVKEMQEKISLVQQILHASKPLYALRLVHTFPALLLYSKRMIAKRLQAFMQLNINYDYLVYHRSIFTISYYQIYVKLMFAKVFLLDGYFEEVTQLSFQTLYARYRFLQKQFQNNFNTLDIVASEEVFAKKYHISWRELHTRAPIKPYVYVRLYNRYHFLGKQYGWSSAPILPWRIQLWTNRILLPKLPQDIKINKNLSQEEQVRQIFSQLGLYSADTECIERALGDLKNVTTERVLGLLQACLLLKQEPSTFASLLISNPYVLQLTPEEFLHRLNQVLTTHPKLTLQELIFNSATYYI